MSQYLNAIAVTQFDTMTKHDYQSYGVLRGTVRVRNNVVGNKATFNKMGKGSATQRTAPSSDAIAMNVGHSYVEATLTDWEANDYSDIFAQKEVLIDEVQELAGTIRGAIGRRRDQILIDAMTAGSFAATVPTTTGGAATGMNLAKLLAIKETFDDNEVPEEGRYIALTSNGFKNLLNEEKLTSADYATVQALVRGEINTFLGFNFKRIGKRTEGGLPHGGSGKYATTGDVQDAFAWHKDAIGEAIGIEMKTGVDWVPHKKSYLASGDFKGGAVKIDTNGIIKVQYTVIA